MLRFRSLYTALLGWRKEDRWLCVAAYLLLLAWCWPLYSDLTSRGSLSSDWEWFLSYYQALYTTLIEHKQFPGINPWNYLGSPLWANPQIGPISHFTPFVLVFGPLYGMKLGIVYSYLLSFEAGRALGRHLFQNRHSAVVAGLLFALNTGFAAHMTRGHICFSAYSLIPFLVLWCLRSNTHRWSGAAAGAVAALMFHYGLHYVVVYSWFLCGVFLLIHWGRRRAWREALTFSSLFLLSFAAVASWRLLPVLAVMRDFPRQMWLPLAVNLPALWKMFFVPELGPPRIWLQVGPPGHTEPVASFEFYAYIGIFTLALALWSLRYGVRFFHWAALICFLCLLGNVTWWQPSRWLSEVPPFSSIWLIFRWRVLLLACTAFAAAQAIDHLQLKRPVYRYIAWALPLELLFLLWPSWASYVAPYRDYPLSRAQLGLPETSYPLALKTYRAPKTGKQVFFATTRANLGIVDGYEPLFGYVAAKSRRRYVGKADYIGEFWIDNLAIVPSSWSPNRIQFAKLPPNKILHINVNPGRGWRANGQALFESARVFELNQDFSVTVPANGSVDLVYRPPGLAPGVALSGCSLILLGFFALRGRKKVSNLQTDPAN